ncbi:hypothetical protein PSQ90_02175 [Devosia rhodophyticola]|uniref:Uncharacterized protein n=1 Tax=Devosia rhodophyticola TaxID=3026423 RepID=A0ABY7YZI1_9HYPH|nr:hypothetical protein [Devosia rhodophyticola]WDR06294.1 hypothetical protein PSQ90_02175 [Devosia rhodophyticola]
MRSRLFVAMLVAGGLLVVAGNTQLFHAAFTSKPQCVDHLKAKGPTGTYQAAKSAC